MCRLYMYEHVGHMLDQGSRSCVHLLPVPILVPYEQGFVFTVASYVQNECKT